MKKSLIALAVAGTFAAPVAYAATANVDIYGVLNLSYDHVMSDQPSPADKNLNRISSNSSRIGFKGTEDLGGGLKGLWQVEMSLQMDGNGNTNTPATTVNASSGNHSLRNSFVGLSGGFGTVLMGIHDTPYKLATARLDPFADTSGDYNIAIGSVNGTNAFELRANNVLAYVSPKMSGFTVTLANVFGAETSNGDAGNFGAWSLSGTYEQGPLYVSLAYEKHDNINGTASTAAQAAGFWCQSQSTGVISRKATCSSTDNTIGTASAVPAAAATSGADRSAWKLGVGYKFGDTSLGLVYEDASQTGATETDRNAWAVNVAHDMGPIRLMAAYYNMGDGDTAADTSANAWALGANYSLSKRTLVYARYLAINNDKGAQYRYVGGQGPNGSGFTPAAGTDPSVISLGVRHNF